MKAKTHYIAIAIACCLGLSGCLGTAPSSSNRGVWGDTGACSVHGTCGGVRGCDLYGNC